MANTKEIKKRIKSTKTIEKITSAMKMTATAKLKSFQVRAESARPYSEKLMDMVKTLSAGSSQMNNPLFELRPKKRALYIVIGADSGLCGSYNNNIIKAADESIRSSKAAGAEITVVPCGRKCAAYYGKAEGISLIEGLEDLPKVSYSQVETLIDRIRGMYEQKTIDRVYLIYSQFISALSQKQTTKRLLPMTPPDADIIDSERVSLDMIFEPDMSTILSELLPQYLNTVVFHALMESIASEYGARMTAMTNANNNAHDLLDELNLQYNKVRQAIITNELIDIVNGVSGIK